MSVKAISVTDMQNLRRLPATPISPDSAAVTAHDP